MEIERKFLLEDEKILKFIYSKKITIYKSKIHQFYTEITSSSETRYRKKDDLYYLSTKKGEGLARDEFEVIISKDEYKQGYDKKISSLISKDRYSFEYQGLAYFVDIYKGLLSGLYILEIEFESKECALEFKPSDEISKFIIKEVTQDIEYKNKNLGLYDLPNLDIDLDKALNLIEKFPNLELNFPSYIDAYQGLRLLLNQIYFNAKFHKNQYEKSKDPENLHQFRVNLRKARSILKSSKDLYDEKIISQILKSIKSVAKSTNQRRDFDVFIEYLQGVDGSKEAVDSLKFVSNNQRVDLDFSDEILIDFKSLLADKEGFYSTKSIFLKPYISKVIRKEIVKIEKELLGLSAEVENEKFHIARVELKCLRYLLESFGAMFEIRVIDELFKRLKFMQELFGKLQDRDVWCDIIDMYDKGELGDFLRRQKSEISVEMFELRGEILSYRAKFLKSTKKTSRVLKAYY